MQLGITSFRSPEHPYFVSSKTVELRGFPLELPDGAPRFSCLDHERADPGLTTRPLEVTSRNVRCGRRMRDLRAAARRRRGMPDAEIESRGLSRCQVRPTR